MYCGVLEANSGQDLINTGEMWKSLWFSSEHYDNAIFGF